MNKKKSILVVSIVVLAVSILAIIFFVNKGSSANLDGITSFEYYSGSTSYAVKVSGVVRGDTVNINFKEYSGADQNTSELTITTKELKGLIDSTKEEDCQKHTYDYQCGDRDGCSYSSFSVSFGDSNSCYKITTKISDFFNNLK